MISKLSVLVVDDSPFARTMLLRALVDIGFSEAQIFQAQNGEEVLQAIKERPFSLVILDIIMTGIDGVSVLKEIKKIHPHSKVIMCSSSNSEEIIKESVMLGSDAFIVKPYQNEALKRVVNRVMNLSTKEAATEELVAKCHVCSQQMIEVNSGDLVSFYCPQNCMKLGPWSNVLVSQAELDKDYEKAKKN
ncbi:response regulator [Anaeroarcus burkinensis]|uniref:response regulator n=1 Tax=Anaeroarcus burkinensis TaxID=82376 RepID=UPI0003F6F367|nr:response regulator [Anaeroarcus burkinensis]